MLYDKTHLRDKNVAFKLKGSGVYFGVVKYVEDDGFWISAPDLILELRNDQAWGHPLAKMVCLANCYGELILPVIALRKWAESHFGDAPNRSETTGPAKHAPMEKHRMISWKSCRG